MNWKYLIQDPPPLLVFEIGRQGVAAVRRNPKTFEPEARAHRQLEPEVVDPAPGKQNVLKPEKLEEAVRQLCEEFGPIKRSDAALILPDGAARLTVLDFDDLPGDAKERLDLIRWRLKKTVPFEIEAARIAYQVQNVDGGAAVFAAITPPEIVEQYEAPLRATGLWPGDVELSAVSALNLVPDGDMTLFAKLAGKSLTMLALSGGAVRMVRTVELAPDVDPSSEAALEDMLGDMYPTLIFIADNLGQRVSKIVLGGFDDLLEPALRRLPQELDCEVEPLRSPQGVVQAHEAGIWGYLSRN